MTETSAEPKQKKAFVKLSAKHFIWEIVFIPYKRHNFKSKPTRNQYLRNVGDVIMKIVSVINLCEILLHCILLDKKCINIYLKCLSTVNVPHNYSTLINTNKK